MIDPITPDTQFTPYWWDSAPPRHFEGDLPASVDVAIVGAGITGLSAALRLLRGGRSVVVLDRDMPGAGASRSAAGYLGRILKCNFSQIMAQLGAAKARAVYHEAANALFETQQLIEDEQIDCYLEKGNRVVLANSKPHLDRLEAEFSCMREHMGYDYHLLSKDKVYTEFRSDRYCGALVYPNIGSVHVGLYHEGLLQRVIAAGGIVRSNVEVTSLDDRGHDVVLETTGGAIKAENAVLATNGYTTSGLRWANKRMIPFTGFMAATEDIDLELLRELFPKRSTVLDARVNIDFFRPAPDRPKILFGGGSGSMAKDPKDVAHRLANILGRVLPELKDYRFSHIWSGQCAGTFDMMPHVGREGSHLVRDGVQLFWYPDGHPFRWPDRAPKYWGIRKQRARWRHSHSGPYHFSEEKNG